MKTVLICSMFGAFYWELIGFFKVPRGLGGALFWSIVFGAFLVDRIRRRVTLQKIEWLWISASFYLGVSVLWTTNRLAFFLATSVLIGCTLWLFFRRFFSYQQLIDGNEFLRNVKVTVAAIVKSLISLPQKIRSGREPNTEIRKGILISIPFLLVLNFLFTTVNSDYKNFVSTIVHSIFTIAGLRFVLAALLHGIVLYCLVTARPANTGETSTRETRLSQSWTVVLTSVCSIVLLFLCFQTFSLALISAYAPFDQLSIYVQFGFWQLVVASAISYGVLTFCRRRGKDIGTSFTVNNVTRAMLVGLLALLAVTAHKLGLLQFVFGFKDQRFAADLLLIQLAVCAVVEAITVVKQIPRFATVVTSSVLSVLVFSIINVDRVATTINPIRYTIDNKSYRDLSYLLTNSFDNYGNWKELMEAVESTPLVPPDYYWGFYHSLCTKRSNGSESRYLVQWRHQYLLTKYTSEISSLRHIGFINLREYFAYRWLIDNEGIVSTFYKRLDEQCTKEGK